jgi:hypothetical protein
MRAEMGLPVHNLHQQGPDVLLPTLLGPRSFGPEALTGLLTFNGILRSQQGAVLPHMMEGAHLAEQSGGLSKRYWSAVTLAGAVAALVGPWILVSVASRGDGLSMSTIFFTSEGWEKIARWTASPTGPDVRAVGEVAFGAAATVGLLALRTVWVQSPLHPLGYALSGSWGMWAIWAPLFLAWVAKSLLLRYGGLDAYRAALPFAYGMILGEFVAGTFWTVVSMILGVPTYQVWMF